MKMVKAISVIMVLLFITVSGASVRAYTTQTPIRIDSNNDFSTYASSGNGTEGNPWIIDDLDINGIGYGYCIYIGNTTDYFTIEDCYLYGAYISSSDNLYRPNAGIVLNNVENAIITGNEIELNDGAGIFLYSSDDNTIQYNNITDNVDYGIAIDDSTGNEIYRNTVDCNDVGIYLNGASGNLIDDNLAFYNEYAIYFENAAYNEITYNSLCLSGSYGVYLDADSAYNIIYTNNFGNNINQAYDAGYGNDWNMGFQCSGNYWSDYNGVAPYWDIDGGCSWDRHPLMEPVDTYGLGDREDPSGIGRRDDPNGIGRRDDPNGIGRRDDPNGIGRRDDPN